MTKTKLTNQTSENQTPAFSKKPKKILKKAKRKFRKWMGEVQNFKFNGEIYSLKPDVGMRFTALPLSPLLTPNRVFENEDKGFFRASHNIIYNSKETVAEFPCYTGTRETIQRGLRYIKEEEQEAFILIIKDDGLIQINWRNTLCPPPEKKNQEPLIIFENWLLALFISMLEEIDNFRKFNEMGDKDFVLEVEVFCPEKNFIFSRSNQEINPRRKTRLYKKWRSPKYIVGTKTNFNQILDLFHRDFFDSAGWVGKPTVSAF